jgi:hypothetical protein
MMYLIEFLTTYFRSATIMEKMMASESRRKKTRERCLTSRPPPLDTPHFADTALSTGEREKFDT